MNYWLRSATLQIGPMKYSLDDLNFSFEVPFEDSDELGVATLNLRNLSAQTRNSIQKGQVVILNAGYEGDIGAIFVGQVAGLSHKHERTDWVTKIMATEALDAWLTSEVNKTYTRSIMAQEMVADLLHIFGLEVGLFELVQKIEYPRGRVCVGKLKDVLREIVVNECQSRLMIRHGQVIINHPNQGLNMGYLLSPQTGLLRTTDEQEVIPLETELTKQDTLEEKADKEKLKKRSSLLNYHLGPADIIKIQSRDLNGRFLIVRGRHIGSTTGDWITEVEVRPI